jgi:predicted AlkP superfamily phosphohydrolase/phosphomutase
LESLKSPESEIIWTTIATGKPPRDHGITDNLIKDPNTNELIIPRSDIRKVKAIWNILSEHKKKVGVIGYQVSWPAEKVNGVIISRGANEKSYSSPDYAKPAFKKLCTEETFNSLKETRDIPAALKGSKWVFDLDSFIFNFSSYLLKKQKFDFFCLYFSGIDVLSHGYWEHMFPEGEDISLEDLSRYKDVIKDYYIWCDSAIGDLLKVVDKNTIVIIVSDHGLKKRPRREDEYAFSGIEKLLEVCGLKQFNYNSKAVMLKETLQNPSAYRKNIQIIGELSQEELNVIRENAKNILKNIEVIETGKHIFNITMDTDVGFVLKVSRRYVNKNFEHRLLINGQEYKISDFFAKYPNSGEHDMDDAIIIISGRDIRQHKNLEGASVYDIAPTLLYLLNIPVAADMPGKVLVNAISGGLLNKKPIRYVDTYGIDKREKLPKALYSPEDEEKIKERMRSLGYIN